MDESFSALHRMMTEMASFQPEFVDEQAGVRSWVSAFAIETPIELDVYRDDDGALRIGFTPPLYRVDTTFRPSFHNIRFTAQELREERDGG